MLTAWNLQTAGTQTLLRLTPAQAAKINKVFSWKQDLSPLPFLMLGKYPKGLLKCLF